MSSTTDKMIVRATVDLNDENPEYRCEGDGCSAAAEFVMGIGDEHGVLYADVLEHLCAACLPGRIRQGCAPLEGVIWDPPAAPDGWIDPISGMSTYVRDDQERGLVVFIDREPGGHQVVGLHVGGDLSDAPVAEMQLSPRMARRLAQLLADAAQHVDLS